MSGECDLCNEHCLDCRCKTFHVTLPIKLLNSVNHGTHWTKSLKQKKQQQQAIKFVLKSHNVTIPLPCTITLTRIAPRPLDDDNLPPTFKWIRDTLADHAIPGLAPGRADSDPRIKWVYSQTKGAPKFYGIEICINS